MGFYLRCRMIRWIKIHRYELSPFQGCYVFFGGYYALVAYDLLMLYRERNMLSHSHHFLVLQGRQLSAMGFNPSNTTQCHSKFQRNDTLTAKYIGITPLGFYIIISPSCQSIIRSRRTSHRYDLSPFHCLLRFFSEAAAL